MSKIDDSQSESGRAKKSLSSKTKLYSIGFQKIAFRKTGFQKRTISHQELSRVQHNSHFSLHHHKYLWKKETMC